MHRFYANIIYPSAGGRWGAVVDFQTGLRFQFITEPLTHTHTHTHTYIIINAHIIHIALRT